MIGPTIEGFRTGQRVRIAAPGHPDNGTIGYITMITSQAGRYTFHVDIGGAKKIKRPVVREFASTQLSAAGER